MRGKIARAAGSSIMRAPVGTCMSLVSVFYLVSCGVPKFDVPEVNHAPTVKSIIARINCELAELIRETPPVYVHQPELYLSHYAVEVELSLKVEDTGELAPSFNFPTGSTFAFNVGATFGA